jgi:GNAT superfamily N-acetyltransferase
VFLALRNESYPDGSVQAIDPDDAALATGCVLRLSAHADGRAARVAYLGPADQEVWFVEVREESADPPAVNLVAFEGFGQRAGALLDLAGVTNLSVQSSDQLGSLRWWAGSGEVDQIYVSPRWRRHRIGTRLALTASCLAVYRGWPRLWSDGQRTELGESFVNGVPFRHRAHPLTHLLAPMTPPQQR